jgi:hypothetical protein
LEEAWPDKSGPADAAKMKKFWALCADYKWDRKLVAGWRGNNEWMSKTSRAAAAALAYEAKLKSMEQTVIRAAAPQPGKGGA